MHEFIIKKGLIVSGDTELNGNLTVTGSTKLNTIQLQSGVTVYNISNDSGLSYYNDQTLQTTKSIKDYIDEKDQYITTGLETLPSITQSGSSVTIATSNVRMYSVSNWIGNINKYIVPEATLSLTTDSQNYIYIDYNAGTPVYQISTTSVANSSDKIAIYTVWYDGTGITYYYNDREAMGLANRINNRLISTDKFKRFTGNSLGESGVRNITITSGTIYYGVHPYSLASFNSSTNPTYFWYHVGGVWVRQTGVTQYNNEQYDNGTSLQNLSNSNKYAVNWIYREVGNTTPTVHFVLGTGDYSITDAVDSKSPELTTLPGLLRYQCYLVGRIIVQRNSNVAYRIDNSYDTSFSSSGSAPQQYSNTRFVSLFGAEYTSIQSAIDSITDASSTNRYVVYVYPGIYVENLVMKPYITLESISRLNGATVLSSSGNLITLTGTTGDIGFRTIRFTSTSSSSDDALIYSTSNNINASFVDCMFDYSGTSYTKFVDVRGNLMKLKLDRCIFDYKSTTSTTGNTYNLFNASGTTFFEVRSSHIIININSNNDINLFNINTYSTQKSIFRQNLIELNTSDLLFNKTVKGFNVNSTHMVGSKDNCMFFTNSGTSGLSYAYYLTDSSNITSDHNRILFTNYDNTNYFAYYGDTSILTSNFDDIDGNWVNSGGTGTFEFISSPSDGDLKISGYLDVNGSTNLNTLQLQSGVTIHNISSDSGFTNADDLSVPTTLAVKNYVLANAVSGNTGTTVDLSGYVTTGTTQNVSGYKTFTSGITSSYLLLTGLTSQIITGLTAGQTADDKNIRFLVNSAGSWWGEKRNYGITTESSGHTNASIILDDKYFSIGKTLNIVKGESIVIESNNSNININELIGLFVSAYDTSNSLIQKSSGIYIDYINATVNSGTSATAKGIDIGGGIETYSNGVGYISQDVYGIHISNYVYTENGNAYGIKIDSNQVENNTGTGESIGLYVGTSVNGGSGKALSIYSAGKVEIADNTTSTNPTTGALVVTGGVGINENLNVNGLVRFTNTTLSTSQTTGALVVSGGVGIGDSVHISGQTNIYYTENTTGSSTGALIVTGGTNILGNLYVQSIGSASSLYNRFGTSTQFMRIGDTNHTVGFVQIENTVNSGEKFAAFRSKMNSAGNPGSRCGVWGIGSSSVNTSNSKLVGVSGQYSPNSSTATQQQLVGVYGGSADYYSIPSGSLYGQLRTNWAVGVAGMALSLHNGDTNIGVYGTATGETNNWSGYFEGNHLISGVSYIYGSSNISIDLTVTGSTKLNTLQLQSGLTVWNISNDSGFTDADDTSLYTGLAIKNYILSKTGSTVDLSGYVTTGTTQNISGYKTFTSGITINNLILSSSTLNVSGNTRFVDDFEGYRNGEWVILTTPSYGIFNSATTQTISNSPTYSDIIFDGERMTPDPIYYTRTGTTVGGYTTIKVNKSGIYQITYGLSINNTTNNSSNCESGLAVNGSIVSGTKRYSYHVNNTNGRDSVSGTIQLMLSANDLITLKATRISGTGTLVNMVESCSLNIIKLK